LFVPSPIFGIICSHKESHFSLRLYRISLLDFIAFILASIPDKTDPYS